MTTAGTFHTNAAVDPSGIETIHRQPISQSAAKIVSPPARHTPTIQFMLNAQIGYRHMSTSSICVADEMIDGSTLKKNGNVFESGHRKMPIAAPIAGMNHTDRLAYARALSVSPAPMNLPMITPMPLPKPIKNTHVSWLIVPVMLNAVIASVPACAKIEFCTVMPKPQNVSFIITGSATFKNFATKPRSNEKYVFKLPHASK